MCLCLSHLWVSIESFFHIIYPIFIYVMVLLFPHFLQFFFFCFFWIGLLLCLLLNPLIYYKHFLSLFWKVLFYLYCLTLFRFFLSYHFFTNNFLFIYPSCVDRYAFRSFNSFFLCFTFLSSLVCSRSFQVIQSSFLMQILSFSSDSFGEYLFSLRLVLHQQN